MKYPYALIIILLTFCGLLTQCARRPKVTYTIPADYPESRRQQIIEIFNKGEILYKANCAECHGIFTKGKDKIPNFSKEQIDNYSARFLHGDPQNHAIVRKMSPEQLSQILIFLRYKTPPKDTVFRVLKK
jgi:hypothetical protein